MRGMVFFFFLAAISFIGMGGDVSKEQGQGTRFETTSTDSTRAPLSDSTITFRQATEAFITSLRKVNVAGLDAVMNAVDPLKLFPRLSAMGTVTVQKGYLFLLIGFLLTGGLMIFVAETIRGRSRTKRAGRRQPNADRIVGAFKMQVAFEEFVMTLFDPLYFRCHRAQSHTVLAGNTSEGAMPADLEFEFSHRDTYARFFVKCLYFTSTAKGDVRLFHATGGSLAVFGKDIPLYFILGFGGTPDDPKELFLLPAEAARRGVVSKESLSPYSKSGMFFYNSVAERLL